MYVAAYCKSLILGALYFSEITSTDGLVVILQPHFGNVQVEQI